MPLSPNFDWGQDDNSIWLNIFIHDFVRKNLDVFATDVFIKVSHTPYLFQLDLLKEVDPDSLKISFSGTNSITIRFHKLVPSFWDEIEYKDEIKQKIISRRDLSINQAHEKSRKKIESYEEEKDSLKKKAVLDIWEEEKKQKRIIAKLKEDALSNVKEEVCSFEDKYNDSSNFTSKKEFSNNYDNPSIYSSNEQSTSHTITTKFTPVNNISKIARNVENNKINKVSMTDGSIFLKDKGDTFLKIGDYKSAISAYTEYLTSNPSNPVVLKSRATCRFEPIVKAFSCINFGILTLLKSISPTQHNMPLSTIISELTNSFENISLCVDDISIALRDNLENDIKGGLLSIRSICYCFLSLFKQASKDFEELSIISQDPNRIQNFKDDSKLALDFHIKLESKEHEKIIVQAKNCIESKNFSKAINIISESISFYPRCYECFLIRSFSYLENFRNSGEEVDIEKSILDASIALACLDKERKSERSQLYFLRAKGFKLLLKIPEAREDIGLAMSTSPCPDPEIQNEVDEINKLLQDMVSEKSPDIQESIKENGSSKIDCNCSEKWKQPFYEGNFFFLRCSISQAIKHYLKSLSICCSHPEVPYNLSICLMLQSRTVEAEKLINLSSNKKDDNSSQNDLSSFYHAIILCKKAALQLEKLNSSSNNNSKIEKKSIISNLNKARSLISNFHQHQNSTNLISRDIDVLNE